MQWREKAGRRRAWGGVAVGAAMAQILALGAAYAQTPDDRTRASALFTDARAQMAEGRFVEACPRLARSDQLDPEIGTKMNLARCYEAIGRSASAWSTWRAAADAAALQKYFEKDAADQRKQADRESFARARIKALEPQLLHVTLRVVGADGPRPVVNLDGERVPPADWGTDMPVDPGPHGVDAFAPGRRSWSTQFYVAQDGARPIVIVIPPLEVVPPPPPPAVEPTPSQRNWMRPLAVALASTTVALGAIGTGFGLAAVQAHSRASNDCVHQGDCADARNHDIHELDVDATIADVTFAAAGASLVAAGILWWSAPRTAGDHVTVQPMAGPHLAGLGLAGRW
jgi:serine/threonine-protein kinase